MPMGMKPVKMQIYKLKMHKFNGTANSWLAEIVVRGKVKI
jgi:hypothetical protein